MPTDLRDHQREAVRVLCWSSGDYLESREVVGRAEPHAGWGGGDVDLDHRSGL